MINVGGWVGKRKRYEEYWTLRNTTPLFYISSPEDRIITRDLGTSKDRWLDFEHHCAAQRLAFENTYYGGDAYPYVLPGW